MRISVPSLKLTRRPFRLARSRSFCCASPDYVARSASSILGIRLTLVSIVASGLVATSLCGAPVAEATAGGVSPYGEVAHFGGYAEPAVAGKFDYPVGFAVDPANQPSQQEEELSGGATKDHNAVYVLDRIAVKVPTEEEPTGFLQYRLQKLSSTGTVLGSVTLASQPFDYSPLLEAPEWAAIHPMISLAVDSAKHRVYALVESMISVGNGEYVPVAQELVAWNAEPGWSTGPHGEPVGTLQAASEYSTPSPTGASRVAGSTALEPGEAQDLATPEAIVADPATHDVVIEAQRGVVSTQGGPTILQRVHAEPGAGTLGEHWIPGATIAPQSEPGTGLFTTTTGFGIDLYQGATQIARLAQAESPTGTSFTNESLLAPDQSGGANLDEAVALDGSATIANDRQRNTLSITPFAAGSPITRLTNGFYAAIYGHAADQGTSRPLDTQAEVPPWDAGGTPPAFWNQGAAGENLVGNTGVRLFEVSGTGYHIVTTVGGQPQGHECNLDSAQLSLAAGANESLFVLSEPNTYNGDTDDEVIEFAPGGKGACPVPSGEVKVTAKDGSALTKVKNKNNEEELVAYKGSPVKFDASGIEFKGETPFEFNWNPTGVAGEELVSKIEAARSYDWPSPTVEEYVYNELGAHEGSLRVVGDYGTSIFPFKVRVVEAKPPVATFAAPASITAGQAAEFNAAASTPTPGSAIADYRWQFGDNSPEQNTESAQESHVFATPGVYTVKLTVIDEVGKEATSETPVTVAQAPCVVNCGGGGGGGSGIGNPPPSPPPTTTTSTPPSPPQRPLTNRQKLALALAACHKKKSKRASCERQAHKRYTAAARKSKGRKKKR